jgi:hypothetical protein
MGHSGSALQYLARTLRARQLSATTFQAGRHRIAIPDRQVASKTWSVVIIDGSILALSSGQQFNLFMALLRAALRPVPALVPIGLLLRSAGLLAKGVDYEALDRPMQQRLRDDLRGPILRLRRKLEAFGMHIGRLDIAEGRTVGYLLIFPNGTDGEERESPPMDLAPATELEAAAHATG